MQVKPRRNYPSNPIHLYYPEGRILIAVCAVMITMIAVLSQNAAAHISPSSMNLGLIPQQLEPDVRVSKGASGEAIPGQDFSYFISYGNQGQTAAHQVILTDTLPNGMTYVFDNSGITPVVSGGEVAWNLGTVYTNTSFGFDLVVHIPSTATVGTQLSNRMDIRTSDQETDYSNNVFTHTITTMPPKPDLHVSKGASGDAVAGQDFSYFVAYGNQGSATANSVILTDTLPNGVTYVSDNSGITSTISSGRVAWNLGSVPVNTAVGFDMAVHIDSSVGVGTQLTNTLNISTSSEEGDTNNNSFMHVVTTVPARPDLRVSKGAIGDAVAGQDLNYFIVCNNQGSATASNVFLTDTLPANVTYVSDDSGLTHSLIGTEVIWNLGTLSPGASFGFNLTAHIASTVTVGTLLTNTVTTATSLEESDYDNNSFAYAVTTVPPGSDLYVTQGSTGEAVPGEDFGYFVSYGDQGAAAAANAILTDTLPTGVVYVSDNSGITPHISGNLVAWNLGGVNSGASYGFDLTVHIASSVSVGTQLINRVDIASDALENDYNNNFASLQVTTVAPKPDLTVNKGASGIALEVQDFRYTIVCSNIKSVSATHVVLTDTLPTGVTYVSNTSGIAPAQYGSKVAWNLGTLTATTSITFDLIVHIGDSIGTGTVITNRVDIFTSDDERDYNNNSSSYSTMVFDDDIVGPQIGNPNFSPSVYGDKPITVTASIDDIVTGNHGVASAFLYYGYSWPYTQTTINGVSPGGNGDGVWTFVIPPQGYSSSDKILRFLIAANDNDNSPGTTVDGNNGQYYQVLVVPFRIHLPLILLKK